MSYKQNVSGVETCGLSCLFENSLILNKGIASPFKEAKRSTKLIIKSSLFFFQKWFVRIWNIDEYRKNIPSWTLKVDCFSISFFRALLSQEIYMVHDNDHPVLILKKNDTYSEIGWTKKNTFLTSEGLSWSGKLFCINWQSRSTTALQLWL